MISAVVLTFAGCHRSNDAVLEVGWKKIASMSQARHNLGLVECNGKLYAIGGYNADALNSVEEYDPATDTWKKKTSMPTPRAYLIAVNVSDKIYVIGGISGANLDNITYTYVNEMYDPSTDQWTTKASLPWTAIPPNSVLGNQFITGSAIGGKIYVAGGASGEDVPTYIYDPQSDTWSDGGKSMSNFNFEPYSATSLGNFMYVWDGYQFNKYDKSTNQWTIENPLNTPRSGVAIASSGQDIFAAGGYRVVAMSVERYDRTEKYGGNLGTWTNLLPIKVTRHSAAMAVVNNRLYVAGGASMTDNFQNTPLADVEVMSIQ